MSEDFTDGYIYVDYSHMDNAADDLVSQTKAIAQTISNMEMELAELKKQWVGDDAQTYDKKQQAWDTAIKAWKRSSPVTRSFSTRSPAATSTTRTASARCGPRCASAVDPRTSGRLRPRAAGDGLRSLD